MLSEADYAELRAIAKLEHSSHGWLLTLTDQVGTLVQKLPKRVTQAISMAIEPVLRASNRFAQITHVQTQSQGVAGRVVGYLGGETFHRVAVVASGAAGGFFGAPGALVDVAASTTLVLRSIQEIAQGYGEDLASASGLADCLAVLAMGGPSSDDDNLDEGYWTTRAALHVAITPAALEAAMASKAAQELASKDAIKRVLESAAFKKVLERYAITAQAAFAEKAVPFVGAAAGAIVNYQFMSHYQRMAHVLYRLKRLERAYDPDQVLSCYASVMRSLRKPMPT